MNKVIRLLLMLLVVPLVATAQFQFGSVFPADSSATESHGLVVDNNGNVWNGVYNSRLVNDGAERRNIVSVYNSEGVPLDFSPIWGVTVADTLLRFGPITGISKGVDGNIYVSVHGYRETAAATESVPNPVIGNVWRQLKAFIVVLDPSDGSLVEVVDVTFMRTEINSHAPNRVAVTEDGFAAVSFVFPGSPINIYDPADNWSLLNTITTEKTGFSRTLEISADGSKLFNPNTEPYTEGGAPGHIQVWAGDDVFSEYEISTPLAIGADPGAIARYPNSDLIFFSGGGSGNAELGGTLFKGDRFYGANINTGTIVTTFDWNYGASTTYRTPRAMAFSDDGQHAYIGTFTPGAGGVQHFNLAGEISEDVYTVRFTVNTATIPDTVRAGDLVQIRGVVNGSEQTNYYGNVINWGSTSVSLNNVGGDYWSVDLSMKPGDQLTYKFYTAKKNDDGAWVDHTGGGWESDAPGGGNYNYTLPENTDSNVELPVMYFNRQAPFESKPDSIGLFFRVNVGAQVATGAFDPETMVVGVRGSDPVFDWGSTDLILSAENVPEGSRNVFYSGAIYVAEELAGSPFKFKYVYGTADNINTGSISWDNGEDAFNPDGDGNNQANIGVSDTTYAFKFYEGRRPPTAEVVQASLQFAVNVGVLEELGLFNRAIGDRVYIPGGFNGWDTNPNNPSAQYNEALDVWTQAFSIREEVGSRVEYKYFVRWDDSRFDSTSPNYVPNLDDGNGWEEPGITGGGNRVYTFTNEAEQTVDDFGSGQAFFNGVPPQGVIKETLSLEEALPVTFRVDMTAALTHSTPFNPATDELFVLFHTPIFALTQELPTGDAVLDEENTKARVKFSAVDGEPNWYELTLDLKLPTENHIGFTLLYEKPDGSTVENGGGFAAGRRYYRYITPLDAEDPDNIIWPDSYQLADVVWKADNLDWEFPPDYGLGTSIDRGNRFETPNAYALYNNYPNPFNPTTNISFNLPQSEFVELSVYNVLGQKVATILSQQMTAGTHSVSFNARNLASGVYIYQIRAGSFVQNKTMMLVK